VCGAIVSHGTLAELAPRMDAQSLCTLSRLASIVGLDVDCWWCPICSCLGAFGPVELESGLL
jgi:hypothetical protein